MMVTVLLPGAAVLRVNCAVRVVSGDSFGTTRTEECQDSSEGASDACCTGEPRSSRRMRSMKLELTHPLGYRRAERRNASVSRTRPCGH